jgi:hypothetical protein
MQRNNPAPAYNPNNDDQVAYRGGSKGFYDRNPGQLLDPASLYSDPNMGGGAKGGIQGPPQGIPVAGHDDLRARQARNITAVPQPPRDEAVYAAGVEKYGAQYTNQDGTYNGNNYAKNNEDFQKSRNIMRPPQQTGEVAQPLMNEADMPPLRHVDTSRQQRAQGIASMLQPSPYRPQFLSNPPRQLRQIQQMPRQQVGRGRYNGR